MSVTTREGKTVRTLAQATSWRSGKKLMVGRRADAEDGRREWSEVGYRDSNEAARTRLVLGQQAANENIRSITQEHIGLAFGVLFSAAYWILIGYGYWRMFS